MIGKLRPASLRGRVVWAVLALVTVVLVALFVTVDLLLAQRLRSELRTRLTDRVALAEQLDGALQPQDLANRLRGDGVSVLLCSPQSSGSSCVSADPAPQPPGQSDGSRPGAPGTKPSPPAAKAANADVQSQGSVLYVRTTLPSTGQQLTLSVDSAQVGSTLHGLILFEVVGGLIALVVVGALLAGVVGTALRPLDRMTALARRIAGGDRGQRLGTGRPDTELGRTATAFDGMLNELESSADAATAAEDRLRAFLGDVSHELRTPLAGLVATTETLLRDEPDRAGRERAYVTLVRETQRVNRLVDDLLTVTRLDTGLNLTTAPLDLVEVVRHELDRAAEVRPDATPVALTAPDRAPLVGDAIRIGQILANLLANARTAAGPDGTIRVEIATTATGYVVEVSDDGPGVPAADRERIFDRLVRLDEARSRDRGGFGLGLPIARALARAHGGELGYVESDSGARFQLRLPAG